MTHTKDEAFLEWYDNAHWGNEDFKGGCKRAWNAAIKQALAEPVQEPEHIVHSNGRYSPLLTRMMNKRVESNVKQVIHLYDEPPPAQPAPVQEPVSDYIKKIEDLIQERDDARSSRDFYKRRADALQEWQSKMRDPERTIVCDILANGCTLEPAGDRYTTPPAAQPAVPEPSPGGVLFAVEQAIENGDCPFAVEIAFDAYEVERRALAGITAAPEKGQP
jgi:hypothetical protein